MLCCDWSANAHYHIRISAQTHSDMNSKDGMGFTVSISSKSFRHEQHKPNSSSLRYTTVFEGGAKRCCSANQDQRRALCKLVTDLKLNYWWFVTVQNHVLHEKLQSLYFFMYICFKILWIPEAFCFIIWYSLIYPGRDLALQKGNEWQRPFSTLVKERLRQISAVLLWLYTLSHKLRSGQPRTSEDYC